MRVTFKLPTLLVILGLSLSVSAQGQRSEGSMQSYRPWEFFDGKTSRGTPLCGIATTGTGTSIVRNIAIKQLASKDAISVTLYKEDWTFKSGASVPVVLDFFDNQPLALTAYADGKVVDIELPTAATAVFLSLMNSEKALRISFEKGSDAPWGVPLKAIHPELKKFVACGVNLKTAQGNKAPALKGDNSKMPCDYIRFTGLAATKFPHQIEDALKSADLEDTVARDPIRCKPNNSCSGIGYFRSQKARILNQDDKYLAVIAPVDLVGGRRDIFLLIQRSSATCDK